MTRESLGFAGAPPRGAPLGTPPPSKPGVGPARLVGCLGSREVTRGAAEPRASSLLRPFFFFLSFLRADLFPLARRRSPSRSRLLTWRVEMTGSAIPPP